MSTDYDAAPTTYRAKRKRRTAITLGFAIAVLAGAFYYGYTYWTAGTSASTACPTGGVTRTIPAGQVAPSSVTVNVYNTTAKAGLAARTGDALRAVGFKIGKVSNDPLRRTVAKIAEIRYGAKGAKQAKTVLGFVPGSTLVKDKRADASVDLAVGQGFVAVKVPAQTPQGGASPSC
ncbi:MAG TPA: LytR C-terminal domain-containing protein [Candidatus Lustribacter sp.]|nr:LytR C-terminal domain-containing protein [Candidatus Lustribacter sp.]